MQGVPVLLFLFVTRCCVCTLGRTRVIAQASCSIVEPRATRPNEGLLMINVNFTPMCAPRFVDRV